MAYQALFGGAQTTLASYTSDSGHTHTLRSGSGTLRTDGSGNLEAVTANQSAYYTSNYAPPTPHYRLKVTFDVRDLGNIIVGASMRAQADGDRLEVRSNGFDNTLELVQYTNSGATETELDSVATSAGTRVVEVEVDDSENYEWFVGGVSQGTGTISSQLADAGTVGYSKFSENLGGGERLIEVETTELGGGTDATITASPGIVLLGAGSHTPTFTGTVTASPGVLNLGAGTHAAAVGDTVTASPGVLTLGAGTHNASFTGTVTASPGIILLGAPEHSVTAGNAITASPGVLNLGAGSHELAGDVVEEANNGSYLLPLRGVG